MNFCGICNEETNGRAMVLDGVYYQSVCSTCAFSGMRNPDSSAANYHRARDREDHAADILQPHEGGKVNLEFARQYKDMWDNHYSEEEIRQIRREL